MSRGWCEETRERIVHNITTKCTAKDRFAFDYANWREFILLNLSALHESLFYIFSYRHERWIITSYKLSWVFLKSNLIIKQFISTLIPTFQMSVIFKIRKLFFRSQHSSLFKTSVTIQLLTLWEHSWESFWYTIKFPTNNVSVKFLIKWTL